MSNKPQFRIKRKKNEDIQRLLKRWKRKSEEFGIKENVLENRYYTKPTTKNRKMMMDAKRNNKREVINEKIENGQSNS